MKKNLLELIALASPHLSRMGLDVHTSQIKDTDNTQAISSTAPNIYMISGLDPLDQAALCSLFSRSPLSALENIASSTMKDTESFHERYVVQYGHRSIQDCGSVCIFVEGISQLAAKALEDYALFRGQEVSTRYVDFSNEGAVNPFINHRLSKLYPELLPLSRAVLESQQKVYAVATDAMTTSLLEAMAGQDVPESQKVAMLKGCKAKVFDVTGSLLPLGSKTSVAWTPTIRDAADHSLFLCAHPLPEVSEIGKTLYATLEQALGSSVKPLDAAMDSDRFRWMQEVQLYKHNIKVDGSGLTIEVPLATTLDTPDQWDCPVPFDSNYPYMRQDLVESVGGEESYEALYGTSEYHTKHLSSPKWMELMALYNMTCEWPEGFYGLLSDENIQHLLATRPRHQPVLRGLLPSDLQFYASFNIDYRSLRDLLRHRPFDQSVPVADFRSPMFGYYLDQMPADLREQVLTAQESIREKIIQMWCIVAENDNNPNFEKNTAELYLLLQYLLPMGTVVRHHLSGEVSQLIYLLELRTKEDVHFTLRDLMRLLNVELENETSGALHIKADSNYGEQPSDQALLQSLINRGSQDIIRKEDGSSISE